MNSWRNRILFALFFVSGFCGLLYQIVWLRLGLASFGVITPVVSVIVSVFMLGLGLGSWLGGRFIGPLCNQTRLSAITFYGLAELMIGVGAFCVPAGFTAGTAFLLSTGESNSLQYLAGSALVIGSSIFLWSTAMGTTYPFVMAFVEEFADADKSSFSHLYLANAAGAVLGTLTTVALLIELLGLHKTLAVAASLNFLIAAVALFWSYRRGRKQSSEVEAKSVENKSSANLVPDRQQAFSLTVLFATGFVSMAMEVIWTRTFTLELGTLVYSFAELLATYLLATCMGSYYYRRHCSSKSVLAKEQLLMITAMAALLPVIAGDFRIMAIPGPLKVQVNHLIVLLSISPFCCSLGYLTPLLIDELSQGDPVAAGKTYALNILGCIVGPLLAGYLLLPTLGARVSLIILALPLLALACLVLGKLKRSFQIVSVSLSVLLLCASMLSKNWEEGALNEAGIIEIRRDYAATVASYGQGMEKNLLVNGIGITFLTPMTKYMAHLPLAFSKTRPQKALTICFGMGVTFRSLLSWGIQATAVELVPSVRDAFVYYFDDAKAVLQNPRGRIVVDDGRRFLARTKEKYDVITIDPPPPIETAGSSLLYSKDFYKLVKQHLQPGGILQLWVPISGMAMRAAARSLVDSFPYVKVLADNEISPLLPGGGLEGYYFMASDQPFENLTTDQFISKMPEPAIRDLQEFYKDKDPALEMRTKLDGILHSQVDLKTILSSDRSVEITDDRPFSEYFWWRKHFSPTGK